jgi:hypothetical protein
MKAGKSYKQQREFENKQPSTRLLMHRRAADFHSSAMEKLKGREEIGFEDNIAHHAEMMGRHLGALHALTGEHYKPKEIAVKEGHEGRHPFDNIVGFKSHVED